MDKMRAILNTVPEDKDSFIEKIFCTNNERAIFYLLNSINKSFPIVGVNKFVTVIVLVK